MVAELPESGLPACWTERLLQVSVKRVTDLRNAKWSDMVAWVCTWERLPAKSLALVTAAIPCHTWTRMEFVNASQAIKSHSPVQL